MVRIGKICNLHAADRLTFSAFAIHMLQRIGPITKRAQTVRDPRFSWVAFLPCCGKPFRTVRDGYNRDRAHKM